MDEKIRRLERKRHESLRDEASYLIHLIRAGIWHRRIGLAVALCDPAAEMTGVQPPGDIKGIEEVRALDDYFGGRTFSASQFSSAIWWAYTNGIFSQKNLSFLAIEVAEHAFPLHSSKDAVIIANARSTLDLAKKMLREPLLPTAASVEYESLINFDWALPYDADHHIGSAAHLAASLATEKPDPPAWFLAAADDAREAFSRFYHPTMTLEHDNTMEYLDELSWQRILVINHLLGRI